MTPGAHYAAPDVLTDGSWQVVRGVQRWVPDVVGTPVRPEWDVRLLVACPKCKAKVDQTCRTKGGFPSAPHVRRLAPRLCPCGGLVAPHRKLCERCRRVARLATNREYLRRWRAARRAVA
jgi:hypothetical protein